jgi:hypothetical protein
MGSLGNLDIESLKRSITGKLVVKAQTSETDYQKAISRWNDVFVKEAVRSFSLFLGPETDPSQAIVAFVESESNIAEFITFVTANRLDLAVCGG